MSDPATVRQFATLARVKRLREDKALESLQRARRAVAEGEAKLERAEATLADSAATLPDRIHAVYAEALGTTTDLPGLDALNHAAAKLERAHQRLEDRRARAAHVLVGLREAAETAAKAHRAAQTEREKYDDLLADMRTEAAEVATAKEEVEIEDLFARPRPRVGEEA